MDKLVSVIIPVYNRENTIERAINSVLNQTYCNIELLIIDDGSTDNTSTIIKKFSKSRNVRIIFQQNLGASVARNAGLKRAVGDYIAFLDSDDEWLPEKIQKQLTFMKLHKATACITNITNIKYNKKYTSTNSNSAKVSINDILKWKYKSILQTLLIQNCENSLPKFFDKVTSGQDFLFFLEYVISDKNTLAYLSEPLVLVYKDESNRLSHNFSEKINSYSIIIKLFEDDYFQLEKTTNLKIILKFRYLSGLVLAVTGNHQEARRNFIIIIKNFKTNYKILKSLLMFSFSYCPLFIKLSFFLYKFLWTHNFIKRL